MSAAVSPARVWRPAVAVPLYGGAHMTVDLASISALYTVARAGSHQGDWAALLILLYDFIAFAPQPFLGLAADRFGKPGHAAALGCLITAVGVWLTGVSPLAAVIAVAVGNALFHAGGGAECLKLAHGRAAWAGVFVAPGAVGLFLGKLVGGTAFFSPWALTVLLAAGALAGVFIQVPKSDRSIAFPAVKGFGLIVAALLVTVAVRSLVGFSVAFPWAQGWQQAVWLTAAVFLGKALGGLLSDRLGWRNVTLVGLIASAPLLAFGSASPVASVLGLLCFNLTMAVTLAGVAVLLPGYEGFAFGLTAAALFVGLTPTIVPAWKPLLGSPAVLMAAILLSALALWAALGHLEKNLQTGSIRAKIKGGGAAHVSNDA